MWNDLETRRQGWYVRWVGAREILKAVAIGCILPGMLLAAIAGLAAICSWATWPPDQERRQPPAVTAIESENQADEY